MKMSISVKDAMDTDVVFIDAKKTVMDSLKMMLQNNVWSIVVSKGGLPEGVVTERDILRKCIMKGIIPDRLPVEQIMSAPLITIDPDAPVGDAMKLIVNKAIRRVYVVENGRVIGRVTQTKAFGHMLDAIMSLWSVTYQLQRR